MTHDSESQKKLVRLIRKAKNITKRIYTFLKNKKSQGDVSVIGESTERNPLSGTSDFNNENSLSGTSDFNNENSLLEASDSDNKDKIKIFDVVQLKKDCNKNKALAGKICVVEQLYSDPTTFPSKDIYLLHPIGIYHDEFDFLAEVQDFDVLRKDLKDVSEAKSEEF